MKEKELYVLWDWEGVGAGNNKIEGLNTNLVMRRKSFGLYLNQGRPTFKS